jgi:hypothetical protein
LIYRESQKGKPPLHSYLLQPVSGQLKLVINKSDIPDLKAPRLSFNFLFDDIGFTIEELQYKNFMDMVENFAIYHRGLKVPHTPSNISTVQKIPSQRTTEKGTSQMASIRSECRFK